jgi:hypothetical protein
MSRDMYRKLNWQGGEPREVAEVVNNLVEGKSNNTGEITLAGSGATTTTIYDERIGYNSVVLLMPITAAAADAANTALPYGAWQDSTTQSAASTTSAYAITLNTTDYAEGITLQSSSQFKVTYSGIYNIQFSLQLSNLANSTENVDVWFRVNGTDVPKSNSMFGLAPRKTSTDPYHVIAALNYFASLTANDYVQIMWATTSTSVTIEAQGTKTSPTRPSTPSAIVTMQYVSGDGYSSGLFGGVYISSTTKGSAVITHPANTATNKTYRYLIVA